MSRTQDSLALREVRNFLLSKAASLVGNLISYDLYIRKATVRIPILKFSLKCAMEVIKDETIGKPTNKKDT